METMTDTASADAVEMAHDLERKIAKGSSTTGDALNRMKNFGKGNVQLGEAATKAHLEELSVEKRTEVFEVIKKDAEAGEKVFTGQTRQARINAALDNTAIKGQAKVDGGASGVQYQSTIVVGLSDADRAGEAANTNAHEFSHATRQKPMGDVQLGRETISSTDLHELVSEEHGSEEETGNAADLRDDAPADYKRAHGHGATFQGLGISREQYQQRIADGDTEGLQQDVIEGGIAKGTVTVEEVFEEAEKGERPYVRNAVVNLLKERSKTADAIRMSMMERMQPSAN